MSNSIKTSQNSPKNYETQEAFHSALQKMCDSFGITVNQKEQEAQQEPTNNSDNNTYQVQFLPKSRDEQIIEKVLQDIMKSWKVDRQEGSIADTGQPLVNNSLSTWQFFSDTVNGANNPLKNGLH